MDRLLHLFHRVSCIFMQVLECLDLACEVEPKYEAFRGCHRQWSNRLIQKNRYHHLKI